jgi:Zn ribbon nucleic-acid-binding protein
VITRPGEGCPACGSMHTYWTFSSADGDVWDCGTCGHQWTVEVRETIKERQADGLGGSHQGSRLILLAGTQRLAPVTRNNVNESSPTPGQIPTVIRVG